MDIENIVTTFLGASFPVIAAITYEKIKESNKNKENKIKIKIEFEMLIDRINYFIQECKNYKEFDSKFSQEFEYKFEIVKRKFNYSEIFLYKTAELLQNTFFYSKLTGEEIATIRSILNHFTIYQEEKIHKIMKDLLNILDDNYPEKRKLELKNVETEINYLIDAKNKIEEIIKKLC